MTDRPGTADLLRASARPRMVPLGTEGLLVSFGDRLSEAANRAALALRAAVEDHGIEGLAETATSLASTYLRFDPDRIDLQDAEAAVRALVATRDWFAAPMPAGRRLWHIPCVFDADLAPQLNEAAAMAGLSPEEAVRSICGTRLRVQTVGFAPGQPYLGELPDCWGIPRQTALTERIPVGAVCVAIRQIVLFSASTPTGWRHVGQTAFRAFRPEADRPFPLRPGDEVEFQPVPAADYEGLCNSGPDGGATLEPLP